MKVILHKILAVLMAFVVLFSTMSFVVDMHFCGDTLVETAIFQEAEGCGMDMDMDLLEGCELTKKNCCTDKQLLVDGQDELQPSVEQLSITDYYMLAAVVHSYMSLFEDLDIQAPTFKDYEPPRVVKDIYKIDETYLI